MKRVVYLAGPYRAADTNGIWQNIQKARDVAIQLWQMGYVVITPHLNTMLMDGACPDSVWLEGDLELMRRSDIVVMLPGWLSSQGALIEFDQAKANGQPVYRWPDVLLVEVEAD